MRREEKRREIKEGEKGHSATSLKTVHAIQIIRLPKKGPHY